VIPQSVSCHIYCSSCRIATVIAIESFAAQVWWQGKVKIEQLFWGEVPAPPPSPLARIPQGPIITVPQGPITRLPRELVELIISYLIYDFLTFRACSMTCYSLYIAAVPHLHHTLTVGKYTSWARPLQNAYNLGLLPLVKRFRYRTTHHPLTPERLDRPTLRYFSALANLQELGIDELIIPSFMPNVRQYFGHFAPTLRSLALKNPTGSSRQILYFIGLFPNLQDLTLCYNFPMEEQEGTDGADLVPLSVPPLCGRLMLVCFTKEELVKDMITFFGGLRFRYMELFRVKGARLLLGACADTLEGLKVYPNDPYGEGFQRGEVTSELKPTFHRKLRSCGQGFRSVPELPSDAGDYRVIDHRGSGQRRFCFWIPQSRTHHRHIPSAPRRHYQLLRVGCRLSLEPLLSCHDPRGTRGRSPRPPSAIQGVQ